MSRLVAVNDALNPLSSRVLSRVEDLLFAYPSLFRGGVVMPVLGMFLITGREGNEYFPLPKDLACPVVYLCCLGSVACVHIYDLSRQRILSQAQRISRQIQLGRNCCFSSGLLHESYERWRLRTLFWKGLDWLSVAHMVAIHFKLFFSQFCGAARVTYQLWAGTITSTMLSRLLLRERLPPLMYSSLSLGIYVFVWISHCAFLAVGDECFGSVAHNLFTGSLASQSFISCSVFGLMSLATPVTQALSHLKTAVGFVGCTITCYLHILFREGKLDLAADVDRWSFFWLFLCMWFCSAASFCGNATLNEVGMSLYMETFLTSSRGRTRLSAAGNTR